MSLSVVDWLLLSQAFEGGHFKKFEICFSQCFGASDTTAALRWMSAKTPPLLQS